VVSNNSSKKRRFSSIACGSAIATLTDNVVMTSEKLTTDLMKQHNCDYLIRGLRNTSDYLYEEQLYQMYKELNFNLKVVYFRANNNISSTFVYELYKMGLPIDKYLPYDKDLLRL
jgi:pantetheine-phosphate adenylyltransferase